MAEESNQPDLNEPLEKWASKPLDETKRYDFIVSVVGGEVGGNKSRLTVDIKLQNCTYQEYVGWQSLYQQPLNTLSAAARKRIANNKPKPQ